MSSTDAAALSSLRSQVDEVVARVLAIAGPYAESPDSAIAADLYAAERSLTAAARSLARAAGSLDAGGR